MKFSTANYSDLLTVVANAAGSKSVFYWVNGGGTDFRLYVLTDRCLFHFPSGAAQAAPASFAADFPSAIQLNSPVSFPASV